MSGDPSCVDTPPLTAPALPLHPRSRSRRTQGGCGPRLAETRMRLAVRRAALNAACINICLHGSKRLPRDFRDNGGWGYGRTENQTVPRKSGRFGVLRSRSGVRSPLGVRVEPHKAHHLPGQRLRQTLALPGQPARHIPGRPVCLRLPRLTGIDRSALRALLQHSRARTQSRCPDGGTNTSGGEKRERRILPRQRSTTVLDRR